ncbi:glycosyltransferase [Roseofilum casamattae]|uniref:Glycosyltransferase n=1 Tax=Roseofilum casamattae BLCC-M143 TaxID=3022442 RepID=A0ABT7BYD2_9CYAN|nr:glycosyltransferase [Roseofilum casamattae]MDJ1184209.1 glycosyltransferase [Roseofilum casamattae BLCC-M143]
MSNKEAVSGETEIVSTIVPAYHAEDTIVRAISSLLQQTYPHWEAAIAADDGIDYLSLLADAGIRDRRLKQIVTGDRATGAGNTRNRALSICTGEILATLDADDAYLPHRLETLVPLALEYGAVIDNTGVHNRDLVCYKTPFSRERDRIGFAIAEDILKPRIPFFPVFRREFIGRGWTSVAFAEDVLFNLELLSRAETAVISFKSLYCYYKRDGSTTQSANAFDTAQRGYCEILDLLESSHLDLTAQIRQAAIEEFQQNLQLNQVFRQYMEQGRCQTLEEFLDLTDNGRAEWLRSELEATLKEFPKNPVIDR